MFWVFFLLKVHTLYCFLNRKRRSSYYNPKCTMSNDRGFFLLKKHLPYFHCLNPGVWIEQVKSSSRLFSACDSGLACDDDIWGAGGETGKTPVNGIESHGCIHGNASFISSLSFFFFFSFYFPFTTVRTKFSQLSGIKATRFKRGVGQQAASALPFYSEYFNISTFKFLHWLKIFIYLFASPSWKYLF